ncbi:V-set and immunoglobulin domain-containing protein 10-like 2 [Conger conger]|uniref:V-set and immunoglobulin domain-containing protein 10-like 2 n=1 Tax=Conger conger TaxID=82655 RepID=UPI002A59D160|nr:V-set and immunoglobulin domain-containing protein 10-like 2 [Conger conger]
MGYGLVGEAYFCLSVCLLPLFLQGLEILDPGEVVYVNSVTKGVVGRSVLLECGNTLPDVYIWGFTMPGKEHIRAVVYNFGQGPRLQKLATSLGDLSVISDSSSLLIDRLPLYAQGMYTCQALYDTPEGARVFYYYVRLLVLVPVSKPYILVSDTSPAEGMTMWMRCNLENGTGPINYAWERENRDGVTAKVSEGNVSLVNVTVVSRNHSGWYRCLANNEVNKQRSDRIWLDIIFGPDVPKIDITPYSVTERGYSALERETVTLLCQASSNPPSLYIWFYNNSQVFTGPQFTITKILRMHTGQYSCLAQNTYLNTRSKSTVTLTVYYPPEGSPTCTILPGNNYTDLALWCTWMGGYPQPSLAWTGGDAWEDSYGREQSLGNATLMQPGARTADRSTFTCQGSHVALNTTASCNATALLPPGEPKCSAYATRNNMYLMLSCSWEGGSPRALLWWASSNGAPQGSSEENANILVLRSSATYSGKAFACNAKHPLTTPNKRCTLKLEAPVLVTQRSVVSVYEGSDVQLTCILTANYPATEITWYNNLKNQVSDTPRKYRLHNEAAWSNLTVQETDGLRDSGQYWCSATNAVGGAEIPIMLFVKKYPVPPNVTISKIVYSSRQRTEVDLEWEIKTEGVLTGFFVERQRARELDPKFGAGLAAVWQKVAADLEPDARTHTLPGLDPTATYAFRITAINQRTTGHPSEVMTPADPPFSAYPAVIGAAIGGMLIAMIGTILLFMYIVRNRNNNRRLHDLIFGMQHSQSRENINFPEDETAGGLEGEEVVGGGSPPGVRQSPRAMRPSPLASAGPTASPESPASVSGAPPPGGDNDPVNVTITVTATS